jgi:hypothetical protein
VRSGVVEPREKRRDVFFEGAAAILVSNVAVLVWAATGDRGAIDLVAVWFAGFTAGWLSWLAIAERRRPHRPQGPFHRQPWTWDADRFFGLILALTWGILNLTWHRWLPGWSAVEGMPDFFVPDTVFALRLALTLIFATSLSVCFWISLRILVDPMLEATRQDHPAPG